MTNKITITFIANGNPTDVEININQKLKTGVKKALQNLNLDEKDAWEAKNHGTTLDFDKSFEDQGIIEATKIILTKGASTGGIQ